MNDAAIETLDPSPFAFITRTATMSEIPQAMGEGFGTLSTLFAKAKVPFGGMPMAHYTAYDTKSTTFELGFPCRPEDAGALRAVGLSIGTTPAGRTMKATHIGPYDSIVRTYDAMTEEMKSKGLTGTNDMWEVYYSPPETPPAEIKTEVLWPIVA